MRLATVLFVATASASFGGAALAQAPAVPNTTAPAVPNTTAPAVPVAVPDATAPAAPMPTPAPVAAPVDPCRSAPACAADGMCSYRGGYCVALADADCLASAACLSGGRCEAQKGHCVPALVPFTPTQSEAKRRRIERNQALDVASDVALGGLGGIGIAWLLTVFPYKFFYAEDAPEVFIPVIGPWMVVASDKVPSSGFAGIFGVLETAPAVVALGGGIAYAIIANESSPMATGTTAQPRVSVVPLASPGVLGLGAVGSF